MKFNRRPSPPRDLRQESGGHSQLHPTPDVVPIKRDWMARAVLILALVLLAVAALGVWLRFRPMRYDPIVWQSSGGFYRGRMLSSLLGQTTFVGFPRADVEHYLGLPDFDERQFWYDLGPADPNSAREPRATVGDPTRLYAVFRYDQSESILEILYSYRRPTLGSANFDSTIWFGDNPTARRTLFTRTLGRLRALGLTRRNVESFLGPPDGSRVRAQYDVGIGGAFIGPLKALVIEYDDNDLVSASNVVD